MSKLNVRLSKNEQEVINTIYEHLYKTGNWITQIDLRRIIGKKIVEKVRSQKRPQLIKECGTLNVSPWYDLTFWGFYLCPKAKADIELLYKYLDLLKQKSIENSVPQELLSSEVEEALDLTKVQSKRLGYLIYVSNVWSEQPTYVDLGEKWKFWMPKDIEDLVEIGDSEEYLEKRIRKQEKTKRCKRLKMMLRN